VIKILLIEDSLAEARFLQEILQQVTSEAFYWEHVKRLSEAIAHLQQSQPFDICLLDLSLPDSKGLSSLDVLIQQAPSLPIVVLTNTNDSELAVAAVRHGAQDYLVKRQVNQDILVRSLRYAIERKQIAEALREANEALEHRVQERTLELAQANEQLKQEIREHQIAKDHLLRAQRLESIGTLASGIAHDLNNILTPMLAIAQLLPRRLPHLSERNQEMLKTLETSAKRGAELIKQILSFARGVEGNRIPLQVGYLLTEVRNIAQQTFLKSIEIHLEVDRDLWLISGDATQLHQVFMNLCVNARDAMPHGGLLEIVAGNCQLRQEDIKLHPDATEGAHIVVKVIDTGTGIPPEIINRIFDPFFTTKEIGKGTGLGLSAAIGIIKGHGGFLDVQSTVGQGSQFQVYLPAIQAPAPQVSHELDPMMGQSELILVVDDETTICQIVKQTLESFNYRVLIAHNGRDAIALYAQHQAEISGVLLDLMMPVMDGTTTISLLQRLNPAVQIVAMSGVHSSEVMVQSKNSGIQRFLPKPFTTKELLQAIYQLVNAAPIA
jgi:two-component system, cell cycle sensor histidine kinase and response regulator CckA